MKAVIYARYSSHGQKDASIEQQVRECLKFAERNDITVIAQYCDHALTGTNDNRPQFQKMIADSERKRFHAVITYKVDRFARNRYDAAIYKARLKRNGVRLMYAVESIPDGPEGVLLESMLEGAAEYYSANLSQNVKRGLEDNARNCRVNTSGVTLGYRVGANGKYEVDPEKARVVTEIFELYAAGIGPKKIAESLNQRGMRTATNKRFGQNSFKRILANERYTGVYIYGDIRVEDGIPQIIPRELFDAVQVRLKKMRRSPAAPRSDTDYILTGKLFCGKCGSSMVGTCGTNKAGKVYHYYQCVKRKKDRTCNKKLARQEVIETGVVAETVRNVLVDEVIGKIADAAVKLQENERDKTNLIALQRRLADTNRNIANMIAAIEAGIITPSTRTRLEELEAEKKDIETSIDLEAINKPIITREQIIYWISQFKRGDATDADFRRTMIEIFVSAIYLYDDEMKIVYGFGGESVVPREKIEAAECSDCEHKLSLRPSNPNTKIIVLDNAFILVVRVA